jgi:hypothetical protein
MMLKKVIALSSSLSSDWATPPDLYKILDYEFRFNDDPCPLGGSGGLSREWGNSTFCNPPYGRQTAAWLKKAYFEAKKGKIVVCLVPSRTDTKWWKDWVMNANEIRFLEGRLHTPGAKWNWPFPSAIVIFEPTTVKIKVLTMKLVRPLDNGIHG